MTSADFYERQRRATTHDNWSQGDDTPDVVVEMLTAETSARYLEELTHEHAEVGATLRMWVAGHAGHKRLALRWLQFERATIGRWHVHALCGQCGVTSGEFFVGDDVQVTRGGA